jgi:hypothetical protein
LLPAAHTISFEGELLRRGFWLYAWKIVCREKVVYYVGRTGDSSSCNAASPFNRIGNHLDLRTNAKANTLTRRLIEAGMKPEDCTFLMAAVGPLFAEQMTFEEHKGFRDQLATLEHAVAHSLRSEGYTVLGIHSLGAAVTNELVEHVVRELTNALNQNAA